MGVGKEEERTLMKSYKWQGEHISQQQRHIKTFPLSFSPSVQRSVSLREYLFIMGQRPLITSLVNWRIPDTDSLPNSDLYPESRVSTNTQK